MATIPVPSTQGAQNIGSVQQPGRLRTPTDTPTLPDLSASSRAVAKNLAQTTENVAEIGATIQKQEEERELLGFQNDVKRREREALYSPGGILSRQGENAVGATEAAEEAADQAFEESIRDRQLSGRARAAARQWYEERKQNVLGTVARHEFKERESANAQLSQDSLQNSKEDAILAFNDPEKIIAAEQRVRQQAARMADKQGLTGDSRQEFIENEISDTYQAVIARQLVEERPALARATYDLAKENGSISADQLAQIKETLRAGTLDQEGLNIAEAAISAHDSLEEQLEYARTRAGDNAELQDEAVRRVKSRFQEREAIRDAQRREQFETLENKALSGREVSMAEMQAAKLSAAQVKRIRGAAELARMERIDPNWDRSTDPEVWRDYQQRSTNPEFLRNITLDELTTRYRPGMSKKDWRTAVSEWRAVEAAERSGSIEGALDVQGATEVQRINAIVQRRFGDDADAQKDAKASFMLEFDRRIRNEAAAKGRELTNNERASVLNEMSSEYIVVDDGWMSDTEDFLFALDEEERMDFVDDLGIPSRNQQAISNLLPSMSDRLRSAGLPVSRAVIEQTAKIASRDAPNNPRLFIDTVPDIVEQLRRNGKEVSAQNVQRVWNANKATLGYTE